MKDTHKIKIEDFEFEVRDWITARENQTLQAILLSGQGGVSLSKGALREGGGVQGINGEILVKFQSKQLEFFVVSVNGEKKTVDELLDMKSTIIDELLLHISGEEKKD